MNKSYAQIRKNALDSRGLKYDVLDEYLIPYLVNIKKYEESLFSALRVYRDVMDNLPQETQTNLVAQYFAFRLFQKDGLIHKIRNHSQIKNAPSDVVEFIGWYMAHPWRLVFMVIEGNPVAQFYEMRDVLSGEQYLVFSAGIGYEIEVESNTLIFTLLWYNGECWLTYGPIVDLLDFSADDIFFFATEMNPDEVFETYKDVLPEIERNPLPFMMILTRPLTQLMSIEGEVIQYYYLEEEVPPFNPDILSNNFTKEYNDGVYRFLPRDEYGQFPDFGKVYYDQEEEVLVITATTKRGFEAAVQQLNGKGFDLPLTPFFKVNPEMLRLASNVLDKPVRITPYEYSFESKEAKYGIAMEAFKRHTELIKTEMDHGKEPDIEKLAREVAAETNAGESFLFLLKFNKFTNYKPDEIWEELKTIREEEFSNKRL